MSEFFLYNLDECETHKGICGDYSICSNAIGSYYCTCQEGFRHVFKKNFAGSASSSDCNGQTCVCCPESRNPNVTQCSSGNFVLSNKTQNIINTLRDSLRFNDSNTTLQNEGQQNEITRFLREVEEDIVHDVLSSLNRSGATEEIIYHYTNETVIVAHSVPHNSSNVEERLALKAGNTTMSIKRKTVIDGTEPGAVPFAMLTSFHGPEIESVLSSGYPINKAHSDYNYTVNSDVVIATISSKWKYNLTDPVILTFRVTKSLAVFSCYSSTCDPVVVIDEQTIPDLAKQTIKPSKNTRVSPTVYHQVTAGVLERLP
ncbi:adhesion G protein-coupled receptor E1-like [Protopterus annectens]|uniref:adhesion G protein-coupled receptor E1-like n=1 Tax=Protopterus annectens TaxID=7888 RepID=UPI001CFB6D7A|nr:adhesion G protein-coupled receptor E1-like [Protopterus annectens]